MKGVDTPVAPQGTAGKGAVGVLAGKGQNGRAGAAGKEEGGFAFRNLLKALGGPPSGHAQAHGKKDAEAEAAEPAREVPESPQPIPAAGDDASATANLLLDALRGPIAEPPQPQPQTMPQPRERQGSPKSGAAKEMPGFLDRADKTPGPAGPALPTDAKADLDATDLAVLAKLAQTDGEPAAPAGERAEGKPLAATPSFTITRQETYLPPVQKLSPFEQVVEPVKQAATELFSARTELADGLSGKSSEIATPTKILHIELKPVELGSIVVKMRLSQGGMEIRIEAAKAETATLLAGDKETLREIVRASGHFIDAVSVETIHVDQLQPDRHNAAPRQDNGQNDSASARDNRQAFDQSRQGEQGRGARRDDGSPDTASSKDMQDETDLRGRDASRYL